MHAPRVIVVAAIALQAFAASAQANIGENAAKTVQIVQSRAANATLLKQYTWNERIDFLVNGQEKDLRLDLVNIGLDGKLQRTIMNDQSAPLPRGFIRRAIAEGKKKDLQQYIQGLGELLHKYTLPTPGAVLNFLDTATTVPSGPGQLMVTGQNVVQPGDSLTIYLDAATKKTQRVTVSTTFQGNPVSLTATFATLASGLNYPAYAEVVVPAKGYDVKVQNFNYQQNGM
ncbi:MAG: hypothetical protein WB493_17845 [Anaeromyxobacteraceae bacterium]